MSHWFPAAPAIVDCWKLHLSSATIETNAGEAADLDALGGRLLADLHAVIEASDVAHDDRSKRKNDNEEQSDERCPILSHSFLCFACKKDHRFGFQVW